MKIQSKNVAIVVKMISFARVVAPIFCKTQFRFGIYKYVPVHGALFQVTVSTLIPIQWLVFLPVIWIEYCICISTAHKTII